MNWRAFDLNLLVVFDAVMQDRSVTRAGQRIGLSQPAMSHALNRLRDVLKDELFVRTPTGMRPTPRAEQLAALLRQALSELQRALQPETFVPATADRRFSLAINNYAAVVVAPPLVSAVATAAPAVQLDLRPSGTLDLVESLDRGELDLAIGNLDRVGERFTCMLLLEDEFVMIMRSRHPAGRGALSAKVLAALPHLDISSSGEHTDFLDAWLTEQGLTRRIASRAPYLSARAILRRSDLAATLSRRIAQEFVRTDRLQIHELPVKSPVVRTTMLWPRRLDNQPAHRWLREMIIAVTKML
jgi:DNA-binding transcriptional LysR family regulator